MKVVLTTGTIRRAKLQSNRHHQQTPSFLQAGCPSCRPTNSVTALKENHSCVLLTNQFSIASRIRPGPPQVFLEKNHWGFLECDLYMLDEMIRWHY